jgi:peptidoglycan-N-acetylglucosamine deacetylase
MTRSGSALRVALTFDTEHPDRPSAPGIEVRLLDLLEARGVRATFFIQGRWAEAYPALARRISEAGHRIGSHSHYHARMPMFSQRGLRSDIALAERAILDTTGVDPRPYFRCPFGAGQADARVQAVIRAAGYRHVGWHVGATDWAPERTAADVQRSVVDGVLRHGDAAVVLLHGWPDRMLGGLEGALPRLADAGATFVGIDELDDLPTVSGSDDGTADEPAAAT